MTMRCGMGLAIVALLLGSSVWAEESDTELAKKTQNPIADLISVPFQNNFYFQTGPNDKTVWIDNIQPVIPIHLNDRWNLITRTIMPLINQPALAPGLDHAFGLGDVNPSLFLSPAGSKEFLWGVGPTFTFPTATSRELGSGKFSAGPAAVALVMHGPWVAGALMNNQWSFAGWGDHSFNQMLIQPFLNYNLRKGWYLNTGPIMTSDWTADRGDKWTVPAGGGGGKLWRVGKVGLPVNTELQAYYNAIKPNEGANWQLRFQIQFLFPE